MYSTAYTNTHLDLHTDATYFSDPAGLLVLHLLLHTGGSGIQSIFVDGFKVAEELRREDPEAYSILCSTKLFYYSSGNDGINIQPDIPSPVLQRYPNSERLYRVRWNNPDRAAIAGDASKIKEWYMAAQ